MQIGLELFERIVLVGSVDDQYVPFHSARLEFDKDLIDSDLKFGSIYTEMLHYTLNGIFKASESGKRPIVQRCSVRFHDTQEGTSAMDRWMGRTAHAQLIQHPDFLRLFHAIVAFP
jgi:hypothetical protein